VSSCSRACCDYEQNCFVWSPVHPPEMVLSPPRPRSRPRSAVGVGVKGRPPWASPSADKSADPVMMPRLRRLSALLRDVRPRGASTGHSGGRAGKRCWCDPSRRPSGDAARRRRCRLFIPLFARLRMSWSDSDEDDRGRTATAHDRCRRRTYPYAVGRGSDCSTQPRRAGCPA
jgi:hypothetical protein